MEVNVSAREGLCPEAGSKHAVAKHSVNIAFLIAMGI